MIYSFLFKAQVSYRYQNIWKILDKKINQKPYEGLPCQSKQVLIVGGSKITFQRVDQNLKSCLIEYSLLKELADLYEWRRNFFDEHLPVLKGSWFTSSYCRDAITYNVLKNFDQILKIVSSRKLLEGSFPRGIILQSDEDKTRFERYRIDNFEFLYHTLRKVRTKEKVEFVIMLSCNSNSRKYSGLDTF